MKKLISLFLALAMVFALCACGSGSQETETKPGETAKLDSGEIETEAEPTEAEALPEGGELSYTFDGGNTQFNFYIYYNEEAQNWAGIEAIDSATGLRVWTYETELYYVPQSGTFTVIGPTTAGFVYVAEDIAYCLNFADGSVDWVSDSIGFNPCGYYAVDDSCCFYFPDYYSMTVAVIGPDGKLEGRYENIPDMYGCDVTDVYCCGIAFGSDGMLHLNYADFSTTTYVFDLGSACCVDQYPYSIGVTPEMIIGDWSDAYDTQYSNLSLYVDDNLDFVLTTFRDQQVLHVYNGHITIDTYVEDVGNDWLILELTSCDDDTFKDWGNIGEYVISYYYDDPDFLPYMELTQVNNGDSVMSLYFDQTVLYLNQVEPVG